GVGGGGVGGPEGRGLQGVVDVLGEGVASRVVRGRALGDADGDGGAVVHGQGEGDVGGELAVGRGLGVGGDRSAHQAGAELAQEDLAVLLCADARVLEGEAGADGEVAVPLLDAGL